VLGMGLRNLLWHWIDRSVARSVGLDALWLDGGIDARMAAFTLGLALISTVAFGLAPALDASRPGLYGLIKGAVPSSPGLGRFGRLRTLVAVQVMLSVLLLSCAGLLVRTLERASRTDVGYPVDDVYVTTLDLTPGGYEEPTPVFERICQHLRRMPGVDGVALAGRGWPGYLPYNTTATGERQNYVVAAVGSGFFDVSRIPILAGREFRDEDREGAPRVAILNQKLAEALWPGENPVGRQLTVWDDKPPLLVVGLAKTVNSMPIGPPFYMIYLPFAQNPRSQVTIHLRAAAAGSLTARAIEKEIRGLGLALPSVRVQTLRESLELSFSILRAGVAALAALGLLALLLGAVGLYGVTAYTASRRTQEIGIRRALGADRLSIYRLIVSGSMRAVGVGLGLGIVLSLLAGAAMKAAFLGSAYDPVALLAAPVLLALTALLAASLPALRASAVDPMIVLREE
jgi:predicted permease